MRRIKLLFVGLVLLLFVNQTFSQSGDGNVGIGTDTPSEKLDVDGNIGFSGELKPGGMSGQQGEVLQSNGDGTMQWAATDSPTSGGSVGFGTWGGCEMANFSDYFPYFNTLATYGFASDADIDGEYAIIGDLYDDEAGNDAGAAYILKLNAQTGQWDYAAKLFSPSPAAGDWFGRSVAISGDYVIVGAPQDDEAAGGNQGTVSIFKRNPVTDAWEIQGSKIVNLSPATSDLFGLSVSISGDYAIVGAPSDDEAAGANQGSALVLKRNASTGIWEPQGAKLVNANAAANDNFGFCVSISGDHALVSSNYDNEGLLFQGSALFFKRNTTTGVWAPQGGKVVDPIPAANAEFGYSVAISGDYAIIGSPYKDFGTGQGSVGAARFLKRNTTTGNWGFFGTEKQNINPTSGDEFGFNVDISGNYAIAGCRNDDETYINQGSAMIYALAGGNWQKVQKVTDPAGEGYEYLGKSCAIDGNTKRFVLGSTEANNGSGKLVFGKFE